MDEKTKKKNKPPSNKNQKGSAGRCDVTVVAVIEPSILARKEEAVWRRGPVENRQNTAALFHRWTEGISVFMHTHLPPTFNADIMPGSRMASSNA